MGEVTMNDKDNIENKNYFHQKYNKKYFSLKDIKGKYFPVGHGLTYAFKIDTVHMLFDINAQCNLDDLEKFYGNKKIDFMIVSHFHVDHMGGIKKLNDAKFCINTIYIPHLNDDEKLLLEIQYFLKNQTYQSFEQMIENLGIRVIEVDGWLPLSYPVWEFNIHQNRGNASEIINDIRKELLGLGFKDNNDVRKYIQINNDVSKIKEIYQKVMKRKSLNETSIFLEHGPVLDKIKVNQIKGTEYMPANNKYDCFNTHSLITADINLRKNKNVISMYYNKLGFVLVPHHSGSKEWDDYICKNTKNVVWIVTISKIASRPYGKVVQGIYGNNQKLYICDKKQAFEYDYIVN